MKHSFKIKFLTNNKNNFQNFLNLLNKNNLSKNISYKLKKKKIISFVKSPHIFAKSKENYHTCLYIFYLNLTSLKDVLKLLKIIPSDFEYYILKKN